MSSLALRVSIALGRGQYNEVFPLLVPRGLSASGRSSKRPLISFELFVAFVVDPYI